MNNLDEVGHDTSVSGDRLRQTASRLTAAVEEHTAALLSMGTGLGPPRVCQLNEVVRNAVAAWDDAVFGHTGTFPVALDFDEDDEID